MRESEAKIVTDSKKKAKVTARKFAETGRTSRKSLEKYRSNPNQRNERVRSVDSETFSGEEGRSKKTITTSKSTKPKKASSKKPKN